MTIITLEGGETTVNTTTAMGQIAPVTVALANGQYLVAWGDNVDLSAPSGPGQTANADIRAQLFNADGTKAGAEFIVTNAPGAQYLRDVVQLDNGNLLFAWQEGLGVVTGADQTGSIFVQQFSIAGTAVGAITQVGTPGVDAVYPDVEAVPGGGYIVAWTSGGNTPSVVAQRYDNANAAVGGLITIDTVSVPLLEHPVLVVHDDGSFIVGWRNGSADVRPNDFSLQNYSAAGVAAGPVTQLQMYNRATIAPELVELDNGNMALAYIAGLPGNYQLKVDLLNPAGQRIDQVIVDVNVSNQLSRVRVDATANGGFAVTWMDTEPYGVDTDGTSIRAAFFSASGEPVIPAIIGDLVDFGPNYTYSVPVNSQTAGDQTTPSLAVLANGDVVITWVDNGTGDGSQSSIQSQMFHVDPTNRAPVALDQMVELQDWVGNATPTFDHFPAAALLQNAGDLDGDALTVVGVSNAQHGTVVLNPDNTITFTPEAGYSGPAIFDYTVSDGRGGSATAQATVFLSFDDNVTIRGAAPVTTNVLANDYLAPLPGGQLYGFTIFNYGPTSFSYRPDGTVTIYPANGNLITGSNYLNLPVGQSVTQQLHYEVVNPVTGVLERSATINVTFEGWMIAGTSGADTLTGTEQADHLVSNGGADTLTGLGGDDYYTVTGTEATIVEQVGGGIDMVRTNLTLFTLPDNVENLTFNVPNGTQVIGRGNDLANTIEGGTGPDTLFGGGGDDRLFGGVGNDILLGEDGDDMLFGASGTDTLYGGAGNDRLDGGVGPNGDQLYGGTGDDYYIIDVAADQVFENPGEGNDTINSSMISTTLVANVENLQLSSTYSGGVTTWALNGTGNELDNIISGQAAANVLLGLDGNDTLYGYAGNDALDGGAGNDQLFGGEGDDTLIGGAGADQMSGGTGNDVYYVDDAGDVVTELAGEGIDMVWTSVALPAISNIEVIALTGNDNIAINGNDIDNVLIANGGANFIYAQGGNDTVYAGEGGDAVYGGDGGDMLLGQGGADLLDGGAGNDALDGGEGNDYLFGGAGDDVLIGGAGADQMSGGAGNDVYYVDDAGDVVIELAGEGIDMVYATMSFDLGATIESLALTGDAAATGVANDLDNLLIGNGGANFLYALGGNDTVYGGAGGDALYGGDGHDLMQGHSGNDLLDGGAGDDALDGGEGDDFLFGDAGNDILFGGSGADILEGGYGNDVINGGDEVDTIGGGSGDDVIDAGAGHDVINGGDGNDTIFGGLGIDRMIGGAGNDTYYVDNQYDLAIEEAGGGIDLVFATVSHALGNEIEALGLIGDAAINGYGNALDNTLVGNSAANILAGFTGADTLFGEGGDDRLDGGDGDDRLIGGAGDDILEGGNGNDAIDGGDGSDYLIGGAGKDSLSGGAGADIMIGDDGDDHYYVDDAGDQIIETATGGRDRVYTSVDYTIHANIERVQITADHIVTVTGSAGNDSIFGNQLANIIKGGDGDDEFFAGDGNDILEGGNGGDRLVGEAGNDEMAGNAGNDALDAGDGDDHLNGGDGDDFLFGGAGSDLMEGGAGNDSFDGGDGNDILIGGTGSDALTGGAGADVFCFSHGDGIDVVTDFTRGLDRIDVTNFHLTFDQLRAAFAQSGANGTITFSNGSVIHVWGVTLADLTPGDFIL